MKLTQKLKQANGVELYRGPSMYGGSEIVTIATGLRNPTRNPKVKNSVHLWSFATCEHPVGARTSGSDAAVCHDCGIKGQCYVNPAVLGSIFTAWLAGKYPKATFEQLDALIPKHYRIRLGGYGNPSASPWRGLWDQVPGLGRRWLSYEHAWATVNQLHRSISMASCETMEQALAARSRGWRFYLVVPIGETKRTLAKLKRLKIPAVKCPYDASDPQTVTCDQCLLCDGVQGAQDFRPNVITEIHGPSNLLPKRNAALKVMQ